MSIEESTVKVGQKWRDLDKRMHGRIREIVRVQPFGSHPYACYLDPRGFERSIRIDRLRKPLFELVS